MRKVSFSDNEFIDFKEIETYEGYQNFLRFALKFFDSFSLCVYDTKGMQNLDDFKNSKWGFLSSSVIDYEYTDENAVTIGPDVMMIYFRIDQVTCKFLKDKKGIFDFNDMFGKEYNRLCDLAFIKNRKVFFCSCTHEKFNHIDSAVYEIYKSNLKSTVI